MTCGIALAAVAAGCQAQAAPHEGPLSYATSTSESRGSLVSTQAMGRVDQGQIRSKIGKSGYETDTVNYAVSAYRLRYHTIDEHGKPTVASGLVALPSHKQRRLSPVVYEHGTVFDRHDVASQFYGTHSVAPPLLYASAGFAAVVPDYLGLGQAKTPHPWMDIPSETSASVDMLRAARLFTDQQQRKLAKGVFVTGFSQGGSAAMGLARALDHDKDPRSTLRAVAPISGIYDFRKTELPAMLNGTLNPRLSVALVACLLTAWQRSSKIYPDADTIFKQPYAERIPKAFAAMDPDIVKELPGTFDKLLTPDGIAMLKHPRGRFAHALRVADATCSWHPRSPIRLVTAKHDEMVAPANTDRCAIDLRDHGAKPGVKIVDPPQRHGTKHSAGGVAATGVVLAWFTHLSQRSKTA